MYKKFSLLTLIVITGCSIFAQQAHRFQNEIDEIHANDSLYRNKKIVLFTGSSTIRMWKDLPSAFPAKTVVNHGFGGSTMKDLLNFTNDLILRYQPEKIFIYEGDNDLSGGENINDILSSADSILTLIRAKFTTVPVYFISAKPSKARWHLKEQYTRFNAALQQFVKSRQHTYYADLWTPMVDKKGVVLQDIFIEDDLHMNAKGYGIWKKEMEKYLK